jgi:DNA-binding winged helix-turn-helix (wHTH) protein
MPAESTVLRIGEWRVDPNLDELSREGQTIRPEPRTMRLLLYLAVHAGRVVDMQELLDEVWPNVVVTQGSVYQAIGQLRRILGDESEHPKYIENLPRRGYRLIAPVAPWDVRPAAADDSRPAAQSFTQADGSVGAEPQLASEALEATSTPVVADATAVRTLRSSFAPTSWAKPAFGATGAVLMALGHRPTVPVSMRSKAQQQ